MLGWCGHTENERLPNAGDSIRSLYQYLSRRVDQSDVQDASINMDGNPSIIMMVGLQGSGKQTGKLAKQLVEDGKKVMMVAAGLPSKP